jgi:hypothetical protein
MHRLLVCTALVASAAVPAVADAAAPNGSYKGVSTGKVWDRATMGDVVDKGAVSFSVRSNAVRSFKLTGQKFMCGGQPVEVKVSIAKIKLNSAGRGKATFDAEAVGEFKIAITVRGTGRATGTVIPTQLCDGENYPAKFSAKRR